MDLKRGEGGNKVIFFFFKGEPSLREMISVCHERILHLLIIYLFIYFVYLPIVPFFLYSPPTIFFLYFFSYPLES